LGEGSREAWYEEIVVVAGQTPNRGDSTTPGEVSERAIDHLPVNDWVINFLVVEKSREKKQRKKR